MNKEEARQQIEALSKTLEQHNYNYYVLAQPTISDYQFDKLLEELIALEKQFPALLSPNSPSQRVGGDITKILKRWLISSQCYRCQIHTADQKLLTLLTEPKRM